MLGERQKDSCQFLLVYLAVAIRIAALHNHALELLDVLVFGRLEIACGPERWADAQFAAG